jgi:hypothetical protein
VACYKRKKPLFSEGMDRPNRKDIHLRGADGEHCITMNLRSDELKSSIFMPRSSGCLATEVGVDNADRESILRQT